jgi:hypothetical protein
MRLMTFDAVFAASAVTVVLVCGVDWVIDLPHQITLSPILALLALFIGAALGFAVFAFADFANGRPGRIGILVGISVQLLMLLLMPILHY